LGTTYGSGDGSTTFNLPDKRGRVSAANDNLGGTAAGRLNSLSGMLPDGNSNGAVGGAQAVALTGDNNGPHAHGNFLTDNGHAHNFNGPPDFPITTFQPGGASVRLQASH
jgi:microcystin-dependent protein